MSKNKQITNPGMECEPMLPAVSNWIHILKESLATIGWTLVHAGCDHYMFVNNLGIETEIEFYHDNIRVETRKIFGDTKSNKYPSYMKFGWFVIFLKDCQINIFNDGFLTFKGKRDEDIFFTLKRIEP